LPPIYKPWHRYKAGAFQERQRHALQDYAWRFQDVCTGIGGFGGPDGDRAMPRVLEVIHERDATVLNVQVPIHVLPRDFLQHTARITAAMGCCGLRVEPFAPGQLLIELLKADPLREAVPLPSEPLWSVNEALYLGQDETGYQHRITPAGLVHLIVQGATGSGKSVFTYGLLAQLCRIPEVLIAMSDPTGLLCRPFTGTVHEPWHESTPADPDAHIALLRRLVDMMDERIASLPPRRDQVKISEDCPLVFVVLEEYPGLIRAAAQADAGDKRKSGGKVEQIKGLIGRLAAESRKAGMRLVILAQRAEASILDSYTRGQMTVKLSFRVADPASIEMLHPTGREQAEEHSSSPAGIALLSAPGVKLKRIKTPWIGRANDGEAEYAAYWDLVSRYAARLPQQLPA
jgi:S-DNA-T family DNA segregation ATPase FtsK/SpoIIIE